MNVIKYDPVGWEDFPSIKTPIEAANLNKMEKGITENRGYLIEAEKEMSELKKSVSDGKTTVAGAITAQGVNTAADATFSTMAANIGTAGTNKYNTGYNTGRSAGITEADARVNTNSASYKSGYSNGFTAGKQQSDGDCHTYCEANQNDLMQHIYKQPGKTRVQIKVSSTGNNSNWVSLGIRGNNSTKLTQEEIMGDYEKTYTFNWDGYSYMTVQANHITTSTAYVRIESTQS